MGIIKSKFRKMEEFDCSMDDLDGKIEETNFDPRSPNSEITRTPLVECRAKSSLISRAANLANISTPIHNDLLMIQDKRFKHLAHSFIDPRSPSDGIIRTPIVIKSSDISSIVNTPRILEEELDEHADNDEDFQKTFEEALSRMSFDCLDDDKQVMPNLIETHFDGEEGDIPVLLQPKITNLIKQSELDPRSPTIGINRTPLVFAGEQQEQRKIPVIPKETLKTFAEQLKAGEEEDKEVEEDEEVTEATKEIPIEGGQDIVIEQKPAIVIDEPKQKLTVKSAPTDVGRVIYGTPVQITSNAPIQQVRTPLSCVANRKRGDLNVGKSPMSSTGAVSKKNQQKGQSQLAKDNGMEANVKSKKAATNPFETAPRKLIR